jgi:hypothetical protein
VLIREMKKYIESKLQTKNDFPSSLEELFKQQEPQYEQNKI